jgi:uncharacterized protein YutE (UPF0331/DUF86 family)
VSSLVLRPEFIRRKIQLIVDELARLAAFSGVPYEQFIADDLRVAAAERILERIILRAIDINEHILAVAATGDEERTTRLSYRQTFERLPALGVLTPELAAGIAQSAGLRNIIVHEYHDLDHRIVHKALTTCLEQYHEYVRAVNRWLDQNEGNST